MRVLHLYRPSLPGQRAQAIQVLHTCHALAMRGHDVTLLADQSLSGGSPMQALALLGLPPTPRLDLRIAPVRHRGLAGLWFRAAVATWWRGSTGVVIARDKKRLREAVRLWGKRHMIIVETHELDSALAAEAGVDATPKIQLERGVLEFADALVANCRGTLTQWEEAHGQHLPSKRLVCYNATASSRLRSGTHRSESVVRCVTSFRNFKGVDAWVQAAPLFDSKLQLIGGAPEALSQSIPDCVEVLPAVSYTEVPDILAESAALGVPLRRNCFGVSLANPLKLWDYLATDVPIVAPRLPTMKEIERETKVSFFAYEPDDPVSLSQAVNAALRAAPRAPVLRSWDERAAELEGVFS